ncbi:pilus assembly protein CpaE [Nakamurella flavida]|uniref:Pilus assembly protein CpaE n=1 Tax=Nakamurella flavida TaxID=363630 RepID=A0A938YPH2_9ACTN|nr:pilus assembly protein CpaE [Nakamurella flavida]MBM9476989.1 pilus assembly protein CpaE [Nakamurella flavida]MDP9779934.1 hypothetical protein [Nakamurella flavida]
MISVDLAARLRATGLRWHPTPADRFTLLNQAFDGDVFTISDMVVEAHHRPEGTVLGFNGTTEWALDSAEASEALWLPREDQLRGLLAGTFRQLTRDGDAWVVTAVLPGGDGPEHFAAAEAADAYGSALLALLAVVDDAGPAPEDVAPSPPS